MNDAALAKTAPATPGPTPRSARRIKLILALLLLGAAAVGGRMWWRSTHFEETNNAYVDGHISIIAPRINGVVTKVLFKENQYVRAGDVLVELDGADFAVRVEQIKAKVLEVEAETLKLDAQIEQSEGHARALSAQSARHLAQIERYRRDAERQIALNNKDMKAVSETELNAAIAARDSAYADDAAQKEEIKAAKAGIRALQSAREALQAHKKSLAAELKNASLQLDYTTIKAPVDGRIGNKAVEVGGHVSAGQRLLAIIQNGVWITANFKETQLHDLAPGQKVRIKLDTFADQDIEGQVESFAPASGAKFALLPPDNATGNFTKIVQRVPVKVVFAPATPKALMERVVPGMSALVEIDLRQGRPDASAL